MIRTARASDAHEIIKIYNHFVLNTTITFESEVIDEITMKARICSVLEEGHPWIVKIVDDEIVAYANASKWRMRVAYRHTLEVTVYVKPGFERKGFGRELYQALFTQLRAMQVHSVVGGIALPNDASIALHEQMGMKKVGHFEQVGRKFERWIDVGFWQRLL